MSAVDVPPVHVIATDEVADAPAFLSTARELIEGGRDRVALHLRLRRITARRLEAMARELSAAADDSGAWCVINGRVDVALAAGAQAVQLGFGALPAGAVRRIGSGLVIGASVHSVADARAAAADGADYLLAGSVYATATHPDVLPAGPGLVTSCAATGVPVIGIGGIDAGNAGQVMAAGACGIAVIRAVWLARDPKRALQGLIERAARR